MRKELVVALIGLTTLVATYEARRYLTTRHPFVEEVKDGWAFTYDLCVPMPYPVPCTMRTFTIAVPKGTKMPNMPNPVRPKDIETLEDARIEAEMKADMIENVHKK